MDSLTQATLGAAIGQALLGEKAGKKAAILGGIAGTIPDLDILLFPFFDHLQRMSIHRGFSHSILFCVFGAFLISYILSRIKWTKEISYLNLWILNFLALMTHVTLDAFTTYGTQLFLPFSDRRVSLDSINIIDPVYTVPLLMGLLMSLFFGKDKRSRKLYNLLGLGISTIYLLLTIGIKSHIEQSFRMELQEQNIEFNKLLTVPVGVASMNWYGVAKNSDTLFIGKLSDVQHNHVKFESFPINDHLLDDLDPWLVNRLMWFSQGFYTVAEKDGKIRIYNMQCDMQGVRYFGDYKAPTAFYYEIKPLENGAYKLESGMHMVD